MEINVTIHKFYYKNKFVFFYCLVIIILYLKDNNLVSFSSLVYLFIVKVVYCKNFI